MSRYGSLNSALNFLPFAESRLQMILTVDGTPLKFVRLSTFHWLLKKSQMIQKWPRHAKRARFKDPNATHESFPFESASKRETTTVWGVVPHPRGEKMFLLSEQ